MKKGIILARVSTPEQQKQGLSLDEIQLPSLKEYAKEHDIEIVPNGEFVFQETGADKLRKKFDAMIDFLKETNDIKAIIAFRVDRLTRNYRDAVAMDDLRKDFDKELHFVDDRLILTKNSYGRDIQDWDLKVFLAKQHINRCQADSYNTIQSKIKSQEVFGKVPFGYRNFRDSNNKAGVKVIPYEAEIVKKIFELYATGVHSYLSIAEEIRHTLDKNFLKSKVEKILKHPFYMGEREYKGELIPHKYETLVTKELWKQVEDIRNGRGINQHKGKKKAKNGIYTGLITCKTCGCAMTPDPHIKVQKNGNRHKYLYYKCTGGKGKHPTKGIEEKALTEQFATIFSQMKLPENELKRITDILLESHKGKIEFNKSLFDEYTSQIKKYQTMIENAYEDKCAGSITPEKYYECEKKWRAIQDDYRDKLDKLQHADKDYYITVSYLLDVASRSYELFTGSTVEEKRQIIGLTLSNLFLDNGNLEYTLQSPFDSIFVACNGLSWGG